MVVSCTRDNFLDAYNVFWGNETGDTEPEKKPQIGPKHGLPMFSTSVMQLCPEGHLYTGLRQCFLLHAILLYNHHFIRERA